MTTIRPGLIRGGYSNRSKLENRLFFFMSGVAQIIDGLVMVLSLGHVDLGLMPYVAVRALLNRIDEV